MKKKIIKISLSENKNIYPSFEEMKNYDLFINRYGNVYDKDSHEIIDLSFDDLSLRQVISVLLAGCSGDGETLEQILTIQQIDKLRYLYLYFGTEVKYNNTNISQKFNSL